MKKVLALILAVAMLATLNVGALADESASGIVAYGGGGPAPVELEGAEYNGKIELERPADETAIGDIPIRILTASNIEDNNITISFAGTDYDFQFIKKVENYEATMEPTIHYNAWEYLAKPKAASIAAGKRLCGTIKVDYFYSSDPDRKLTNEFTLTMAPIVEIQGVGPGETIECDISVNYMCAMGDIRAVGQAMICVSPYDVSSASFKNGLLVNNTEENMDVDDVIWFRPNTLYTSVSDIGKVLKDILVVELSNGKAYEFPVEMTIDDFPSEDFDRTEPCLNSQDIIANVMIGTTYHYTIKFFDINNTLVLPLSVEVSDEDNSNLLEISDVTVDGKEITFTLTPKKEGEAHILFHIKDAAEMGYNVRGHETFFVYPEGGIIPDDAHNPDKPKPPVTDPDNPDQPTPPVTDPDNPDKPTPKPPVVDSGAAPADKTPQATDNPANDDKTTDALRSGDAVELKLTNGSAGLSTDTIDTLGGSKGKLTLQNGGMTVTIPGGFGKVNEPGRIYFPFDYEDAPRCAADMLAAVKGESAKSEARKVGGSMTLPTTVTVTLKTKLTGTVHIYLYNEETGKFTLLASPVAKDGTVTFSTRQMGYMLLTTGRI